MFKATDFTYDGVYSGVYGLKIATFDSSNLEESSYTTPSIATVKPSKSRKFFRVDSTYDAPPEFEFSVVSETAIPDSLQREILVWLDNRQGFKPLKIHQPEFDEYTYNCIFLVTSLIYHRGSCVGFNLRAMFDSPYQYGREKTVRVTGNGTTQTVSIVNNSDIIDGYVFPVVTFKPTTLVAGNSVRIVNLTDDPSQTRPFVFTNTALNSTVEVDNELKIIASDTDADLLSKFDGKHWLRLRRGKNNLQITINGELVIVCPQYIKIRF